MEPRVAGRNRAIILHGLLIYKGPDGPYLTGEAAVEFSCNIPAITEEAANPSQASIRVVWPHLAYLYKGELWTRK